MDAHKVFLMAWSEGKAPKVAEAVEAEIRERIPATDQQELPNDMVVLDAAASTEQSRVNTPWLVTTCESDDKQIRKAVIWLCNKLQKPILKLTDEDYNEHGMGDLLPSSGPAYNINLKVFNELQHTITGWPGGKPNADDRSEERRVGKECRARCGREDE